MTGRFNGQSKTYAICGPIRRMVSVSRTLNTPSVFWVEPVRAATTNPGVSDSGLRQTVCVFQGESDDSILRLAKNDGVVAK